MELEVSLSPEKEEITIHLSDARKITITSGGVVEVEHGEVGYRLTLPTVEKVEQLKYLLVSQFGDRKEPTIGVQMI